MSNEKDYDLELNLLFSEMDRLAEAMEQDIPPNSTRFEDFMEESYPGFKAKHAARMANPEHVARIQAIITSQENEKLRREKLTPEELAKDNEEWAHRMAGLICDPPPELMDAQELAVYKKKNNIS